MEKVVCDTECYANYFLVQFRKVGGEKVIAFEKFNNSELNRANVLHLLRSYTLVTFNGIKYDQLMLEAACQGFTNANLKRISDDLIVKDERTGKSMQPWEVRRKYGIARIEMDQIDLIEVAPLTATLKIYAGRLKAKKLQDLPIEPDQIITDGQRKHLMKYCDNDLDLTELLYHDLEKEIELRIKMSAEYGVDLRSKSDAQIAEAVIRSDLAKHYNVKPKKAELKKGTTFKYTAPDNIQFETPELNALLEEYKTGDFVIDGAGYVNFNFKYVESDKIKSGKNKGKFPPNKRKLKFKLNGKPYTAGIGGIHSKEKSIHHTSEHHIIREYDVASFYPRIILNNQLFPKGVGKYFLKIYESIVNRRLKAKATGDKITNESLKIVINGSFGKFGSKYSFLYAPNLMMQVTITGQLSLLMLIERLELAGISVISANTDGIVLKMEPEQVALAEAITLTWEFDTDYDLDNTNYISLSSRDVNDYIAIKDNGVKGKGVFADQSEHFYTLRKSPINTICVDAVVAYIKDNVPVEKTIMGCNDILSFTSLRVVNGGAIKNGVNIGKAIRWYQGADELDAIHYATTGNKVPKSDGGVPLMDVPDKFPSDVDIEWYIKESEKMLKSLGVDTCL